MNVYIGENCVTGTVAVDQSLNENSNNAISNSAVCGALTNCLQNKGRGNFTDCNNAPVGFYCASNVANAPNNTTGYVYILSLRFNDDIDYQVQLCFVISSTTIYVRNKTGENWGSWRQI